MKFKITTVLLSLFCMSIALTALTATPAFAEGPYWRVNGTRLEKGAKNTSIKGQTFTTKTTIAGASVEIKCETAKGKSSTIEGNGINQGKGASTLLFENCTEATPKGCVSSKAIETVGLDWSVGIIAIPTFPYIIAYAILFPQEGETLASVTISGCLAEGKYPITGSVAAEIIPEGEEVKEATILFPEPATTQIKLEGQLHKVGLVMGGGTATLAGKLGMSLVSGEKFGVFKT